LRKRLRLAEPCRETWFVAVDPIGGRSREKKEPFGRHARARCLFRLAVM
jgi:hypothetical protein